MNNIQDGDVIYFLRNHYAGSGSVRVVYTNPSCDIAVLISVAQNIPRPPFHINLSALKDHVNAGALVKCEELVDGRSGKTDEQLAMRYPRSNFSESSYPAQYRAIWKARMEAVADGLEDVWLGRKSMRSQIAPIALEHNLSIPNFYRVLYRFLANGSVLDDILPATSRCGARGRRRTTAQGVHLGRKSLKAKVSGLTNDNFPLSEREIENIKLAWRRWVKRKTRVKTAFIKYLQTFHSAQGATNDGEGTVVLKRRGERPSLKQFFYHGAGQDPGLAAARRQFGERNYLLNGRPLDGERIPKTYAVGAVGEQDVSSNDVHLQSTFYPERCVGPCRVLPIVDKQIGYISGIYCGWRANAAAVRLAILNSASAKQDFCERLGFSISEDEWFSVHHCQYLMDRGEGNCEEIFGVLRNIRSSGEYVQTGRADFKGRVEQTHRILHATDLPGATGGKPPSRGENDPAEDACLNITEFMQEVVEAVLWHNNKACVPHLLSLEMRRDHVTPTRMEIMKWATANGYNRSKSCSESRLVSALCPEIEAVVTESGIYLTALRNGRSGDRLLLEKCRYLGAFAKEKNWLAKARKDGRFNIQARFNPNDLRKIWYHDNDAGLVEFLLSTDDPGFPECATYEDVIATRTYETIIHQPVREDALQADSDRQLRGQARVEKAKIRTSEAKARVGSKGKRTARDRRENNILENQLGGQSQVLVPSMQAIPLHVDSSHTVRRVEQLQSRYFVEAPCRRA